MLLGRRPQSQELGATLRGGPHPPHAGFDTVCVPLALEAFTQRNGNCAGLGLAGQSGQLIGESAGFFVPDVEAHGRMSRLMADGEVDDALQCQPLPERRPRSTPGSTRGRS